MSVEKRSGGPTIYGYLLFLVMAPSTQMLSELIARKLILIYIYGYNVVRDQGLQFIAMPKGKPWTISNGDILDASHLVFVFGGPIWFLLFFGTFIPIVYMGRKVFISRED